MVRRCTYPSIHFFVSRSRSVVDCAHIQAFTFISTKTLSSSRSVVDCAHNRAFTLSSQDHGRLPDEHISKHSQQKLSHVLDSLVHTRNTRARPPVLTPVPMQAIHSRACLNLYHCDIQSTAQKSPCVNTFLRPSSKKKTETFLSVSGSLGRTHRTKTTDT